MKRLIHKKKLIFALTLVLVFNLGLDLSRAETKPEINKELKLAQAKLPQAQAVSPVISMDFQDADLKDVLKVFSQQANLNFIAGENVKDRKITLYLESVSIQDVLDTIMNANNLTYEQKKDSKIFVVKESGAAAVETITKIFPLQYARVKGYELTAEGEKKETKKEIDIAEVIKELLTEHGRTTADPRTNSLVVTDVPSQFPKIEQAIKELDIKLPQVMIEAEVIEAGLDAIDKLGIQWGAATDGELIEAFGAARTARFPFTQDRSMRLVGPAGAPSGLYLGYVNAMNLGGTLAMLAKDTNTKILARPKILTLNNETAEIKITANTAISSLAQTSSAEGIATQTITADRVETGISLKVTPQINKKEEVTMIIEPSVINTEQSKYFPQFVDPQIRSAKTTVTVGNGETVIIGGLVKNEDTKISRKLPFFGDIPLLGSLFHKKDDQAIEKEVIIFITPHLVKDGGKKAKLAMEKKTPLESESLGSKEETIEKILDSFEKAK